jgi:hypothetical protein
MILMRIKTDNKFKILLLNLSKCFLKKINEIKLIKLFKNDNEIIYWILEPY